MNEMKGEHMGYPTMTAEQYVVDELQNSKYKIRSLEEDVSILKAELSCTKYILNQLCSKMAIRNSETVGRYIYFDTHPTEIDDPKLFAELKPLIENKGAD